MWKTNVDVKKCLRFAAKLAEEDPFRGATKEEIYKFLGLERPEKACGLEVIRRYEVYQVHVGIIRRELLEEYKIHTRCFNGTGIVVISRDLQADHAGKRLLSKIHIAQATATRILENTDLRGATHSVRSRHSQWTQVADEIGTSVGRYTRRMNGVKKKRRLQEV